MILKIIDYETKLDIGYDFCKFQVKSKFDITIHNTL